MRFPGRSCIVLLGVCCSANAGDLKYLSVHVDSIDPAKVKQFADARLEWITSLAKEGASDPWWGSYFQVGSSRFVTLRPFDSFAELDRPNPPMPSGTQAAVKTYNERSDDALVFPHLEQIWVVEDELSYQPPQGAIDLHAGGAGKISFEGVKPNVGEQTYATAWRTIIDALRRAKYPLARFTFWSRYGDGRVITIWMARTTEEFARAPPLDEVLAENLGEAKAAELVQAVNGATTSHETFSLRGRLDMSSKRH